MAVNVTVKARRADERGAAIFIVVMVITLLTAVGVYAARSATMVDVAAGHARQALQTQYVAEYGAIVATTELGNGAATEYVAQMATGADDCRATSAVDEAVAGPPPCYKMFQGELKNQTATDLFVTADNVDPGSLGGPVTVTGATTPYGLQGNFVVEITDPTSSSTPIAGTVAGGPGPPFYFMQLTLTSVGQVLPAENLSECNEKASAAGGTQTLRSHVVVGPIAR
jgi:hypothetical protein